MANLFSYAAGNPVYETFGPGKNASTNKMADVAQQQADLAMEQWNMYKEVFAPYEKQLVEAQSQIVPNQLKLDQKTLEAQYADTAGNMPINEEIRQQRMRELQRSEPVADKFYEEAQKGLNIPDRMNAAQADVQQGYDVTKDQLTRDMSRTGLGMSSGRFTDMLAQRNYAMAKDISAARTNARRTAEDVNFGRLGTAMSARGSITGLPTYNGGTATNPLNQGMAALGLQKAGQTFTGLAGAQEGFATAAEAKAAQTSNTMAGVGAIAAML